MQRSTETLKKRGFKIARGGVLSCVLAAVMTMYLPAMAFAGNYDIDEGSVDIHAYEDRTEVTHKNETHTDSTPTVTSSSGNATNNTVTITAENNATANVTLSGVNIDTRENQTDYANGAAAVKAQGAGNVNIELEGNNSLISGYAWGGIHDDLAGVLTIKDVDNDGTLTAIGGYLGAGIGSGEAWHYGVGRGSDITIEGGTVTAIGGIFAAGIGGSDNDGQDIKITGGTVTAIGRNGGAGIGGGYAHAGRNITISGDADVSVSGGGAELSDNYGVGAAIGSGGGYTEISAPGVWVDPDIDELYDTGSIKVFAPGTTAAQITGGSVQPTQVIVAEDSDPEDEPGPLPQQRAAVAAIVTADDSYAPASATTAEDVDAAFYAAVDMQVEELLKEINALIAEGKLNEANALIAKGLKINAGTHKGFNASTLAKLGEASRMGIAVTVNFVYAGTSYSVTIPGHSVIDPVSLVDQNGYCGFLNLVKYFG